MNTDRKPWTYSLVELRAVANEARETAVARGLAEESMKLVDVIRGINADSEIVHIVVYIGVDLREDNSYLAEAVNAVFYKHGFPDVEIRIEW